MNTSYVEIYGPTPCDIDYVLFELDFQYMCSVWKYDIIVIYDLDRDGDSRAILRVRSDNTIDKFDDFYSHMDMSQYEEPEKLYKIKVYPSFDRTFEPNELATKIFPEYTSIIHIPTGTEVKVDFSKENRVRYNYALRVLSAKLKSMEL